MENLVIPGQTRQQKREVVRKALSGARSLDITELLGSINDAIGLIHYRIDVVFESMRLLGATNEETFAQAEKNVQARQKILSNHSTIPQETK